MQIIRGYPVKTRRFELGGQTIELLGPDDYEKLLDDPRVLARFEHDEFMPYWAEFWPACLLLADWVASWPIQQANETGVQTVLELGCGLGLASLIASSRGYRVIASDYDDDALAFVLASAAKNQIAPPETRFIDWRIFYPDLLIDRIIAAEILYEARNLAPIAAFLANHLSANGRAFIVDANRSTANAFPTVARAAGLSISERVAEYRAANITRPIEGRVFEISRENSSVRGVAIS